MQARKQCEAGKEEEEGRKVAEKKKEKEQQKRQRQGQDVQMKQKKEKERRKRKEQEELNSCCGRLCCKHIVQRVAGRRGERHLPCSQRQVKHRSSADRMAETCSKWYPLLLMLLPCNCSNT